MRLVRAGAWGLAAGATCRRICVEGLAAARRWAASSTAMIVPRCALPTCLSLPRNRISVICSRDMDMLLGCSWPRIGRRGGQRVSLLSAMPIGRMLQRRARRWMDVSFPCCCCCRLLFAHLLTSSRSRFRSSYPARRVREEGLEGGLGDAFRRFQDIAQQGVSSVRQRVFVIHHSRLRMNRTLR